MRSTHRLAALLWAWVCCLSAKGGVEQWSSAKSVTGDFLGVGIATKELNNDKEVYWGRTNKGSKNKPSKGTYNKSKNQSVASDKSKRYKDSSKNSKSDSDTRDSSSKTKASTTKSSKSGASSSSSESTSSDRTKSSSKTGGTRDPSETSDQNNSQDNEEKVTEGDDDEPTPSKAPYFPPPTVEDLEADDPPVVETVTEPTVSPQPSPTMSVDEEDNVFGKPTPLPTYGPTPTPRCPLDSDGSFGTTSQDLREFEYFYQVETTSDVTQEILTNEILPPLERGIGTRLVALLFDGCGKEEQDDLCEAQGFSTLPLDRALAGVSCLPGSRSETANTCFAVDGALVMYFAGECDDTTSETMAAIREVITSGDFDRIDPRILDVIYLDISEINLDVESTTKGTSEQINTKGTGYAIVLLTAVFVGLAMALLLFLRGTRPQDKNFLDNVSDGEGDI